MTDQPPEPPKDGDESRFYAKRRMPFEDSGQKRPAGVIGAGILYGAAMLACLGLAGFMAFGQQRPLASVAVIAPLAGALWFFIRMLMVVRPQIRKD